MYCAGEWAGGADAARGAGAGGRDRAAEGAGGGGEAGGVPAGDAPQAAAGGADGRGGGAAEGAERGAAGGGGREAQGDEEAEAWAADWVQVCWLWGAVVLVRCASKTCMKQNVYEVFFPFFGVLNYTFDVFVCPSVCDIYIY